MGRKTANVVLNVAFGEETLAVDTHIFHVSNRNGLASGKDSLVAEQMLMKRVPKEYMADAHHWLILHGRYVCVAHDPPLSEGHLPTTRRATVATAPLRADSAAFIWDPKAFDSTEANDRVAAIKL